MKDNDRKPTISPIKTLRSQTPKISPIKTHKKSPTRSSPSPTRRKKSVGRSPSPTRRKSVRTPAGESPIRTGGSPRRKKSVRTPVEKSPTKRESPTRRKLAGKLGGSPRRSPSPLKSQTRRKKSVKSPSGRSPSPLKSQTRRKKSVKSPSGRSPRSNTPLRKSAIKSLSPRSKEYECFKIKSKDDCEQMERCHWDDNRWWYFFKKSQCKSRLFHDLNLNYPLQSTDYKTIVDRLFELESKEESRLTKKERIDLEVLQVFRNDYVVFDRMLREKVKYLYELKTALRTETDLTKKEKLIQLISEKEQTTIEWLLQVLKTKEFLRVFFGSVFLLSTLYFTPLIADKILTIYERFVSINVNADQNYKESDVKLHLAKANEYLAEGEKYRKQGESWEVPRKLAEELNVGTGILALSAWVAPATTYTSYLMNSVKKVKELFV